MIIRDRLQCYFTPMSRSAMTIILQWSAATLQHAIQHTINIIVLIMKRSSHQWSAVTHPIDNNDKEYWSSLQWSAVIPRQRIYIFISHILCNVQTYKTYITYRATKNYINSPFIKISFLFMVININVYCTSHNVARHEKGCSRGSFVIIYAPLWTENHGRRAYNGANWKTIKIYGSVM